jgi:RNA polymerase sigma-70 factor (ECF subfamily)
MYQQDGITVSVLAFDLAGDLAGDRVRRIWAIRNPHKLRPWRPS